MAFSDTKPEVLMQISDSMHGTIHRLLIANRGEIAVRIMRTAHEMGIETVAVYSDADADALHVQCADRAVHIGASPSDESYLLGDVLIDAAKRAGADAIHPGYGFLSENPVFARACEDEGIVFVGPSADAIEQMGAKQIAKNIAIEAGVPVVPGYQGEDQSDERLIMEAKSIELPLLIKASAGGGGRGMRLVHSLDALEDAIADARSESQRAFGDDTLLLERYLERTRHIEVQVLADHHGNVIHLGERECSIQRRYQKIIEESPSPVVDAALRERMGADAVALAKKMNYVNAGTVEFIVDGEGNYFFLEMNTRLQVEHPVTEEVYGMDLVRAQLQIAMGLPIEIEQEYVTPLVSAIEVRLYAEDPANDFMPTNGKLWRWALDDMEGIRIDSGVREGDEVSTYYDPMLAKLISVAPTREEARRRMIRALRSMEIAGVETNREFLVDLLEHKAWQSGDTHTHFIDEHFPDGWTPTIDSEDLREAAIAAVLADYNRRMAVRSHLPHLQGGYRNNAFAPLSDVFTAAEQEVVVHYRSVGRHFTPNRLVFDIFASADDKEPTRWTAKIVVDAPGNNAPEHRQRVRVQSPDGMMRVWTVSSHVDAFYVHSMDVAVTLQRSPRFPLPEEEIEEGSCVAPMSGTVLRLLVEEGERVDAGQTLMVLEAMKMEHRVTAPETGIVASLSVEQGDNVNSGVVLAVVEGEDGEDNET